MELFAMGVTICLLQWSFGDLSVDGILCGFYTRQSVLFSFKPEVPCRITNKLSHSSFSYDPRAHVIISIYLFYDFFKAAICLTLQITLRLEQKTIILIFLKPHYYRHRHAGYENKKNPLLLFV